VDEFLKRSLPTAAEQADNFILWLGDRTEAGQTMKINPNEFMHKLEAIFDGAWRIRGRSQSSFRGNP